MNKFKVGNIVKCEREAPDAGTWHRYKDRIGRVLVPNNEGEVGLTWRLKKTKSHDEVNSWFLPGELTWLATSPILRLDLPDTLSDS